MMRHIFSICLLGFVAVLSPAEARKPNVVFFLVDDMGYMDIGANNPDSFYETPHIDRLARSGMRFTNGYAANPVCSPTRYSIMTGKYPTRVDATNFFSGRRAGRFLPAPLYDRMDLDENTLAEAFKAGGYSTFFAGKWHLGPDENYWPENQGFDVNKGGWRAGAPFKAGKFFTPYANPRLKDGPKGEHLTVRLGTETVNFIEANRDKPFLAYLSFYSVHTPLMAPAPMVKKYEAKAKRLGLVGQPEFAFEEQVHPGGRDRRVRILQKHATYAAMVESVDNQVGRVLDKLRELNLDRDTIICFTSDNGGFSTSEGSPTSNLPLRGGKGWLYEGGIREPFLIAWPGVVRPGGVEDTPVISTDFYPTILEMLGLPFDPKKIDGKSFTRLLKGKEMDRGPIYWHFPHYSNHGMQSPGGAIRDGDYKLLEYFENGTVQLFNLSRDIGEHKDLAKIEPEKTKELTQKLHRWRKQVGAQMMKPNPNYDPSTDLWSGEK